jgi:hypothetical protein
LYLFREILIHLTVYNVAFGGRYQGIVQAMLKSFKFLSHSIGDVLACVAFEFGVVMAGT